MYKVKGSGMMKAGKLCVSAIFRPVPSVVKSGEYKYLSIVSRPSHALPRDIGLECVTFGYTLSHRVSKRLIRNVVRVWAAVPLGRSVAWQETNGWLYLFHLFSFRNERKWPRTTRVQSLKKTDKECCSSVSSRSFGEKCCVTRNERLIILISSLFF